MEQTPQNPTLLPASTDTGAEIRRVDGQEVMVFNDIVKWRHQMYIDWVATGGLRVTEEGEMIPLTATDFAAEIRVNRTTIYDWPKIIPNFQERVAQRRAEIYSGNRVSAVWRGVFLRAATGEAQQADMILRNFDPNYKAANDKGDGRDGLGLADLLEIVRRHEHAEQREVIDATVTDASSSN